MKLRLRRRRRPARSAGRTPPDVDGGVAARAAVATPDDVVPVEPAMISRLGPIVGLAAAVWWLTRRRRQ